MDWMDFIFSLNYDLWAFGYAQWQAGINMIPGLGYQQYAEAWAHTKLEDK